MVKKLASHVREYKKYAIMTPILVLGEVVLEILIPLFMAELIDSGIDAGSMPEIIRYGLIILLAAIASLAFGVGAGKTSAVAAAGFAKNLRGDMYDHVQEFSFSNIDKFSTASIVTRLTTDVSNVQIAFQMLIRIAARSPGMLIFALVASFGIDAELSLIFLCVMPVLLIGLGIMIKAVHPIFNRVFKTYDKLNNVVQENLSGIRVVKSFNRQDHEIQKFEGTSQKIYEDFSKAEKIMAFINPLMQFCMYLTMLLIAWFGARAIVASGNNAALGLSTGELISLITYSMQILMSLMMISMIFVMLTMARASGERIVEILDEQSNLHDPEEPVYEVTDGSIDFDHVHFSYGKSKDKEVLNDIDLHIRSGQTIGIIGATGSAKSSLVQLIPRLYDVTGGSVKVGGRDVREYHVESLRNQVSMVLQKNTLFSGTIAENLRWGNEDATDEELRHACQLACADEFINSFEDGYDTYIEQGGTNVSGGQKQRLCIARALLKKPKILILDDSTSAVDMRTDAMIRQAFRNEISDTTKIIIAQRAASVQDADKIIVMDDGKIVDVGSHDQLMESSVIYREVYESQNKGGGLSEQ